MKSEKITNIWKLNNICLSKQLASEVITREIRKQDKKKKKENTCTRMHGIQLEQYLEGNV